MPHERSLAQKYAEAPFALIGVNDDVDHESVKRKNRKNGVTWRSFRRGDQSEEARRRWVPNGWPTLYVLDHRGVIRGRWLGDRRADTMAEVEVLIAELVTAARSAAKSSAGREASTERERTSASGAAAQRFPGSAWQRYVSPEDAGFDSMRLKDAEKYWRTTGSSAAMIVRGGAVVAAWGDVDRRYMCHSARKSLLSALYGVHVDAGKIDVDKTLADLDIDEDPPLSEQEKAARISDLLKARSGVYLTAAYEPAANQAAKPPRGSYRRNERWCYNNWDFNALCSIFEQETEKGVFEEFRRCFATPLGMQDYRVRDGYYHYERDKSIHPAYPFKMSARDMARFGLLYLRNGQWKGASVLSERWVRDSVRSYSDAFVGTGYGYMWWVAKDDPFRSLGMFSALGAGEQSIDVIPGADLVFVLRSDTYAGVHTASVDRRHLIRMVLDARSGSPAAAPVLEDLPSLPIPARRVSLSEGEIASVCGTGEGFTIAARRHGLRLTFQSGIGCDLIPMGQDRFFVDDCEEELLVLRDAEGAVSGYASTFAPIRSAKRLLAGGAADAAAATLLEASELFPGSNGIRMLLGKVRARLRQDQRALAAHREAAPIGPTDAPSKAQLTVLDDALERLVTQLKLPGLAAGIVRDGKLWWFRGYGYADLEKRIPVTKDTPYQLASVTKTFASTLAMQQVERGNLDLDASISDFGIQLESPGTITVRHLLNHTSSGNPGAIFKYSGNLFQLADQAVSQASGLTFKDNMRKSIIEPLELQNTGLMSDPLLMPLAIPYRLNAADELERSAYPTWYGGAAGIVSSVSDYAKYVAAIEDNVFVRPKTQAHAFAAGRTTNGDLVPYGVGWFCQEIAGIKVNWHCGWWTCTSTLVAMVPELGLTFVAFTNTDHLSRGFRITKGDLCDSPVAIPFLKGFVVNGRHSDASWPTVDWSGDLENIAGCYNAQQGVVGKRLLAKELWVNFHIPDVVHDTAETDRMRRIFRRVVPCQPLAELTTKTRIASLVDLGPNQRLHREFTLEQPTQVRILCSGTLWRGRFYDRGWIEKSDTHKVVWAMDESESSHGGGLEENRLVSGAPLLPAGTYRVCYETDRGHDFEEWRGPPPDGLFWGIVLCVE